MYSATLLEHAPLEAVYIYFDTATYDEIERDVKVTFDFPFTVYIKQGAVTDDQIHWRWQWKPN